MQTLVARLIRLEACRDAEKGQRPLRVLIVDDDTRFLHALDLLVKSLGHEVVAAAHNGKDAVTLAVEYKPDVVILDIEMPQADGIDAAKEIQRQIPVPILFSTGHTEDNTLDRASEVSSQFYLVKPYSLEQLRSSLRLAISSFREALENEIRILELSHELETLRVVNDAVALLMERFGIGRQEALEKIETAARVRDCQVAEAAAAISTTLRSRQSAG